MVSLLFSFRGRINRLHYWLGSLGVTFAAWFVLWALVMMSGILPGYAGKADKFAHPNLAPLLGIIPVLVIMAWSGYALQFKRFHDRGRTGWISLAPVVVLVPLLLRIAQAVGAHEPVPAVAMEIQPFILILQIINLAFFIDLGCLGSVDGPNQYGDAPGSGPPSSSAPTPAPRMSPAPTAPGAPKTAMSTLFGAPAANAPRPVAQAPAPVVARGPTPPRSTPTGFGRRPTR